MSWENVCLPKSEGGLGLRNFWAWNKTLNLRLIWMLFAKRDSLWVAWNHSTRLRHDNFWTAESSSHHSWIWKALLALRPLAKRFLRCTVGNGKSISYWYDHWNKLGPLIDRIGTSGPMLTGIPVKAVVADGLSSTGWSLPSARTRNTALYDLRTSLLSTTIPAANGGPDHYWWFIEGSLTTSFSSKLTWEVLRPARAPLSWTKAVWYMGNIPKHAFTFWVAHLNRLPIRERTANWGMNNATLCCVCGSGPETRDHLFFHCSVSASIWNTVLLRFGRRLPFNDWPDMLGWISSGSRRFSLTLKRLVAQTVIFYIWKERNARLHSSINSTPTTVFQRIDRSVRDSVLARSSRRKFKGLLSQWFTFE